MKKDKQWIEKEASLKSKIIELQKCITVNIKEFDSRSDLLAEEKLKNFKNNQDMIKKQSVIEENEMMINTLRKSISVFENNYKEKRVSEDKMKLDLKESICIIEDKSKLIAEMKAESNSYNYTKECFLKQQTHFLKQKECLDKEIKELNDDINDIEAEKITLKRAEIVLSNQHKAEVQSLSDDIENNRTNYVKKINCLEDQLSCEHEERFRVLREKHQLENKISQLENVKRMI